MSSPLRDGTTGRGVGGQEPGCTKGARDGVGRWQGHRAQTPSRRNHRCRGGGGIVVPGFWSRWGCCRCHRGITVGPLWRGGGVGVVVMVAATLSCQAQGAIAASQCHRRWVVVVVVVVVGSLLLLSGRCCCCRVIVVVVGSSSSLLGRCCRCWVIVVVVVVAAAAALSCQAQGAVAALSSSSWRWWWFANAIAAAAASSSSRQWWWWWHCQGVASLNSMPASSLGRRRQGNKSTVGLVWESEVVRWER